MKMAYRKFLMALPILFGLTASVHAHPHMFFTSTAQFIVDEQARLSQIRVVFLIDELNTLYTLAELGVNQDGDQTLSDDEVGKIAKNVLKGFGYYQFFTHLYEKDRAIPLGKPSNVSVQLHQQRLGLVFSLPLETPLPLEGRSLSLKLYDPTYFTEITIDLQPTIVGGNTTCSIAIEKPESTKQTRQSQVLLSQLSREETPDIENVGALFADTTRLTCKG